MPILALVLAVVSPSLEILVQQLKGSPAWQAEFVQSFVPAGFSTGSQDHGVFTFAHPSRLRFDYTNEPRRTFALDGSQARLLDLEMGTCQSYTLSEGSWAALPLAALTDPGVMAQLFFVQAQGEKVVLLPRKKLSEIARVELRLGRDGLPQQITVVDPSGNANRFVFRHWRVRQTLAKGFFTPAAPGDSPCQTPGPPLSP